MIVIFLIKKKFK